MNNEDTKTRSQSRKDEVMRKLTNLKLSYTEAAMGFKPFMTDLKDAEKALSVDLTIAGAAAIKGPATKARQDAVPLNTAISKLAGEFKALGLSMSSVTP